MTEPRPLDIQLHIANERCRYLARVNRNLSFLLLVTSLTLCGMAVAVAVFK